MTTSARISGTATTSTRALARGTDGIARYVAAGLLFGVVLVKGEVVSWYRIQEMFRFQGFHMYGILISAMLTAMIAVQLIRRTGLRAFTGEEIVILPKEFGSGRRYIFGGFIFGIGWAFAGACPGPLWAIIGSGYSAFVIVAIAALAGTWTYGLLRPRLPH